MSLQKWVWLGNTSQPPINSEEEFRDYFGMHVSVCTSVQGGDGRSHSWPPMKPAASHSCWSVPLVSWPTLHPRAYTWPLPITPGFPRLLLEKQNYLRVREIYIWDESQHSKESPFRSSANLKRIELLFQFHFSRIIIEGELYRSF